MSSKCDRWQLTVVFIYEFSYISIPTPTICARVFWMVLERICLLGLFEFDFQFEASFAEMLFRQIPWNPSEVHGQRWNLFMRYPGNEVLRLTAFGICNGNGAIYAYGLIEPFMFSWLYFYQLKEFGDIALSTIFSHVLSIRS